MHLGSIAVVSALAFAACAAAVAEAEAEAEPERPRIYYPRHIKREFTNSTITGSDPASTPDNAATTTTEGSTSRRSLGEFLSDVRPKPDRPSTGKDTTSVTTVVIKSTIIVTPTPGPPPPQGTGNAPPYVTVLPTPKTPPTRSTGSSTREPESSPDSGILIAPTGIVSSSKSSDKGTVEPTSQVNTTSGSGIVDPIGSLLTSPSSTNSTGLPTATSSNTGLVILPPPTSSASTTTSSSTLSSSKPAVNGTSTAGTTLPPTYATPSPPITATSGAASGVPVGNSTRTGSFTGTAPTVTGTLTGTSSTGTETVAYSLPTGLTTNGTVFSNSTAPVTKPSLPILSTTVDNSTAAIQTTTASSSSTVVSATSYQAVTSIRPTATVSNTENWLPTTIVIEPTSISYSAPTQSPTQTSSKALPTNIPKLILPDDPDSSPPAGTVPIQIGFLFPLNYVFVASNTVAAAQIFRYLPQALADAGGFSADKAQVSKLVPHDTRVKLGYVTTIAQLNYPQNLVDKLQMDLWSPNSAIYNNADGIVRNLTALINPQIDIHGNINTGGLTGGAVPTGASGSNNDPFDNNNNNGNGNGQGDQSSKQKATTAGIAMGAVGLSVMYGAAMFMVARRYKRKRQSHRRSSSVANGQGSSEMRYTGAGSPALMGGALANRDSPNYGGAGAGGRDSHGSGRSGAANSGRTANISSPVAAENSLGWN
ncbi:Signaling mucin MSB2 [Tolypocladium capitatum]|uniref:Signaling mucin MSB2 n=1 Tax=Tolypocladium capitatum TaxID=45235 RepID=A0A2K3QAP1_9HYPO|nr:Signaling mucin MSB2 [Tolypocladium capitatum]